ncbi:MAG: ATP-binding protein [Desulfosarcinaceae bacterium]
MYKQFTIPREGDGEDFSIRPVTLAFRDPNTEFKFKNAYFENNLQLGRICHLIAIFFFVVICTWNALVVAPWALRTWIAVILGVAVIFLFGLAASYFALDYYARYWQPLYTFYVLATGAGYTYVSLVSGPDLSVFNFVGIIYCLFFCYAFIRLTFTWALAAGNAIVLIYIVAIGLAMEQPFSTFLTTSFYIFGVNLLGMMVCYAMEFMTRRDFMLNELLKRAENRTQWMNARLEQMVTERTRELNRTNQDLRVSIQREKELVAKLEVEEQKLQKSLTSLEQAETISNLGYFEVDWKRDGGFASKGLRRLLGDATPKEGLSYDRFIQRLHTDDRDRVRALVEEAVCRHGTIDCEFRLLRQDGGEIQVHAVAENTYDASDMPVLMRGVLQDITERKQAEAAIRKMEGQLVQAQKMESVGRLAGGVAHDYNNISGIIIGYAELCLGKVSPQNPIHEFLQEILAAANRAAGITRQLLAFARQQTIAPKVIDMNATVAGMLKILRRLIGENIELAWLPGEDVWPVMIDPIQVDQILANLCVNAKDAIADVGKITIETGTVTLNAEDCTAQTDVLPGDYATLVVSDTGKGIAPDTLDKVFEPFFTTKAVGQGTGLGLATVYGIVKQNTGFINVYSELGIGTCIKIYLPRHNGTTVDTSTDRTDEIPRGQGEKVLLVEDDAAILNLCSQMLTGLGYQVFTANTVSEATDIANNANATIDLLITDVIMPKMNGREMAQSLRASQPQLKTLFMSGYTANVIAHHGVLEEDIHFLPKPFSKRRLAVSVRKALSQSD